MKSSEQIPVQLDTQPEVHYSLRALNQRYGGKGKGKEPRRPHRRKNLILTQQVKEGLKAIKVQLDARTTVTLASLKALEFWKKRYPNAKVLD